MSMELRREARLRRRDLALKEQEREDAARDLRTIAASPEGARLLRRLLDRGDIFAGPVGFGETAAFAAGKRAAALELWKALRRTLSADSFVRIALMATTENEADWLQDDNGAGGRDDGDRFTMDDDGYGAMPPDTMRPE